MMLQRIFLTALLMTSSCGKNAFVDIEEENPGEEAVKYLEKGNPRKAITIILEALGTTYSNAYYAAPNLETSLDSAAALRTAYTSTAALTKTKELPELISILASAHAQLYGIDAFSLALALATGDSKSSSSTNELTFLFPYLPAATTDNIRGLGIATSILDSMGGEHFTAADFYKKGLFLTANASLLIKKYDIDGDGSLGEAEVVDLSVDDAISFLSILSSAALSAAAGTSDGTKSGSSAKKITAIQDSINAQEGETQTDKVKNYLVSKK